MARKFTTRMLELNDEGMFDKDILIQNLLNWLGETTRDIFNKELEYRK